MKERFFSALDKGLEAFSREYLFYQEQPIVRYPYDVTNAKITFTDASELNFPDFLDVDRDDFKVLEDGSFWFNVYQDGTTPNTDSSRSEIRFYKDLENKSNWLWNERIALEYGFMFEKLPTGEDQCYFGQIHGESNSASVKLSMGKGKTRALLSLDEEGNDRPVLDFDHVPQENTRYKIRFEKEGHYFSASLSFADTDELIKTVSTNGFTRTDKQYPKAGGYTRGQATLIHFAV